MKKIEDIIKTPNLEIFDNDATGFIGDNYEIDILLEYLESKGE